MDLKFKKKKSTYDTTPGTITFNESTKRIGIADSDSSITEYGGGSYIDEIKLRSSDINGSVGILNAGDLMFAADQMVNRFAGMPADYITVEYSTNNGGSWSEYPNLTNENKQDLLTKRVQKQIYLGRNKTNDNPSNCQLRITIDIPTDTYKFYAKICKFYIWASTNGTSKLTVDIIVYNKTKVTSKTICTNHVLSGRPGYNTVNLNDIIGGSEEYGIGNKIVFTFKQVAGTESLATRNACIYSIFAYTSNTWVTPSNLAETGHMYTWYVNDTVFPSGVYSGLHTAGYKLLTESEVESKIQDSWTWGEYD